MDLSGAFLLHTAPGVRKLGPGRYEKVSIGTTTSARMVRFTEPLGRDYGVRAICGKGGLPDEAIEPMKRYGMVYFAIVGGAAALETEQIEEIEEVAWEELMPECLWKFRVKDLVRSRRDRLARQLALPRRPTTGSQATGGSLCTALTVVPRTFSMLPARSHKPRTEGLTHVIDKGLDLRQIEGLFETAGDYVDIVKLGWGTSYVTQNVEEKIGLYRSLRARSSAVARSSKPLSDATLDEYRAGSRERFTHVEVSDGTIDLPHGRKLELVAELAKDFVVMSEVGSKNSDIVYAPYQWVEWMKDELDAGAWKVITEAREGGTAGSSALPARCARPDRRDRARDRLRGHHLRGAEGGRPGLVRPPLRARGQPRQHPARGSHPARDAPARAPLRHAEGDPAQ